METLDAWMRSDGLRMSQALDEYRDQICAIVSKRLTMVFSSLCYDDVRPDATYFQQVAITESPRRFQRVLQSALIFQSLDVLEHEYSNGWRILPRYGVTRQHLLTMVRWYFDALRLSVPLVSADIPPLNALESAVLAIIDRVTSVETTLQHSAR